MSSAIFVYVTAPSMLEAEKIAETIVIDRLAACANILPVMRSIYHWEGKIERADECVIVFKSRSTLFPALERRVRELHSYQAPAIVAMDITQGHAPYLDWILRETKP